MPYISSSMLGVYAPFGRERVNFNKNVNFYSKYFNFCYFSVGCNGSGPAVLLLST